MKITIPRESLMSALSDVSPVIPTKTSKEILKNVLLTIIGSTATLTATDQEVGIRREIKDVTAESDGSVILPPGRLGQILREIESESVELDIGEKSIKIVSGSSSFKLATIDSDEFPDVKVFDSTEFLIVKSNAIKKAIGRTLFCADTESTRYALGGIAIDAEKNTLMLVATDSRRMGVAYLPFTGRGTNAENLHLPVVPTRAAKAIAAAFPDTDEEAKIAVLPSAVLAQCGLVTVYARLIDGRFPRYQDVIPNKKDITRTVSTVCGPFYSAVRQSQIIQSDDSKGADFVFESGELTINSRGTDVGESSVKLPIQFDGDELNVTFDPKYVGQFLNVCDREANIIAEFSDGDSAALFHCGDDYRYVVMPLAKD